MSEQTFISDGGELERVHRTIEVTPALVRYDVGFEKVVVSQLREALLAGQNVFVVLRSPSG